MVRPETALNDATLRSAFERMDMNGSGKITIKDMTDLLGANHDDEELQKMMHDFDGNSDGTIDFGEFVQVWLGQSLWKAIDADGSGTLDHDEIKAVMPTMTAERSSTPTIRTT